MWPVYVINMASNKARMAQCEDQLNALKIPFERFEAVDGRNLSKSEIDLAYDPAANQIRFRNPLIPGEVGCYLSHIALWQNLIASDAKAAVILEDDFVAAKDFHAIIDALIESDGNWDMVKLYSRRPNKKMLLPKSLTQEYKLATPYNIPNTTLGYVIRKNAAARLLEMSQPFSRPIDEDHKRFWEHGLDVQLVIPPPLSINLKSQAGETIESARKSSRGRPPLVQAWRNLTYRVTYLSALNFHRLLGR